MSLLKMWEEAYEKKILPPEWSTWEAFRAWAIMNKYKIEYGYKGEFSPQGCLKAMPDYKETLGETKKTVTGKGESNASKKTNTRGRGRNSV